MNKILLLLALYGSTTTLLSNEFEEYMKQQQSYMDQEKKQYINYKENLQQQFEAYKKAYDQSFKEYKTAITKKWPTPDVSTKFKWVEYSTDYSTKKAVNYDKGEIDLEVIAKTQEEAKKKIAKLFDDLSRYDVKKAYQNDILEKKVYKKLHKKREKSTSSTKLIADIINKQQKIKLKKQLLSKKLHVVKYNGHFIYKANVKFPPNSMVKKAKTYKRYVDKQSKKLGIPKELIYAIMHSESSFNPMARSGIPAFGLMQIVPRSAGLDTYKYLTGKKKILSSQYLYNSKNNIVIGSTYLKILYSRYLRKIKDPQSRLYCTIAAYNTGAGNVSKAFIGSTNISRASKSINQMKSQDVYQKLMKKLPYNETKKYLYKVNNRMGTYHKLVQNGTL